MSRKPAETPDEDTLAGLLPGSRSVDLGNGRSIDVRELTLAEIGRLSNEFRQFVGKITGADGGGPRDVLELVVAYEEPAYKVAEATTGIPANEWRRAGATRLARVVLAAVEVNLDFFVHCVELGITLGAIAPTNGHGRTPSDTSSDADTPTP